LGMYNQAWQIGPFFHLCAVELGSDIACLNTGFVSRTTLLDIADQCASTLGQAYGIVDLFAHFTNLHANTTTGNLAGSLELFNCTHSFVYRNRQGNSHEAAALRDDLGIDANYLAGQIDQRAARIAGIDSNTGLDKRQV